MRTAYITLVLSMAALLLPDLSFGQTEVVTVTPEETVRHMHEHFSRVQQIQNRLIAGDLNGAKVPARWLVEHDPIGGLTGSTLLHVQAMKASAQGVMDTDDIVVASTHTGEMGSVCGACHTEMGISDQFVDLPDPDEGDTVQAHMARHQWGVDKMFRGLIGPDDRAWDDGVTMFVDVPLKKDDLKGHQHASEFADLADRLHGNAAMGYVAYDAAARSKIYGDVISTCAKCHQGLKRGPK